MRIKTVENHSYKYKSGHNKIRAELSIWKKDNQYFLSIKSDTHTQLNTDNSPYSLLCEQTNQGPIFNANTEGVAALNTVDKKLYFGKKLQKHFGDTLDLVPVKQEIKHLLKFDETSCVQGCIIVLDEAVENETNISLLMKTKTHGEWLPLKYTKTTESNDCTTLHIEDRNVESISINENNNEYSLKMKEYPVKTQYAGKKLELFSVSKKDLEIGEFGLPWIEIKKPFDVLQEEIDNYFYENNFTLKIYYYLLWKVTGHIPNNNVYDITIREIKRREEVFCLKGNFDSEDIKQLYTYYNSLGKNIVELPPENMEESFSYMNQSMIKKEPEVYFHIKFFKELALPEIKNLFEFMISSGLTKNAIEKSYSLTEIDKIVPHKKKAAMNLMDLSNSELNNKFDMNRSFFANWNKKEKVSTTLQESFYNSTYNNSNEGKEIKNEVDQDNLMNSFMFETTLQSKDIIKQPIPPSIYELAIILSIKLDYLKDVQFEKILFNDQKPEYLEIDCISENTANYVSQMILKALGTIKNYKEDIIIKQTTIQLRCDAMKAIMDKLESNLSQSISIKF